MMEVWKGGGDADVEILDGDVPHAPRSCIAQAWSVAELVGADVGHGAECR